MKISYIISMVCLSSMVHAHTNTQEISSINAINFNQIYKEVNATPLLQKDMQSYDVAWNVGGFHVSTRHNPEHGVTHTTTGTADLMTYTGGGAVDIGGSVGGSLGF
jgi:hypothetical protein